MGIDVGDVGSDRVGRGHRYHAVGLAGIIWMANWPFGTPWEKDLADKERDIEAEHKQRHHRRVARALLPILAFGFAITSISILSGPKSSQSASVALGVCSVVCVGLFVVLIKGDRRRRRSKRR
ncbi:hypothetical protein O7621_22945 [Solwaraspora sp. WMMD937]|uniref:hypothetical protein n=1 Tax=Solwaraspora sp. WMMD937 TaxID=3016090 RepID=UPI00249B42A6|nr:hypothetical protein [Solwaraspora sp. WMMD937]WFE20712.1 hypothetical protein O7621_22945 [Solwaraspora sp. WMMD937]